MVSIATPPAFAHTMTHRVCYAETDRMQRVYYANYLVWSERSRTEALRMMGFPYSTIETRGFLLPVREANVRYFGFADYDDEVTFTSWITQISRARVTFTTYIYKIDQLIAVCTVELACVNLDAKPTAIPNDVAEALKRYFQPIS